MAVPRFRVTERQVLMLVLAASFIGFAAVFLLGGFRGHGQPLEPTAQARIRWMPPRNVKPNSPLPYLIADYFDPSLMSLPSAHGFSARMWQRSADAPPRSFEPPAELALLSPTSDGKIATLLPEPSLSDTVNSVVEKVPATSEDLATEEVTTLATVVTQSTLQVEGVLEQRSLRLQPELPAVTADTGLKPTRVRVAVAPDGRVRYVMLDQSCGNEAVDAQALDTASRLLFEPATSTDPLALTWGMVKFRWATK